MTQCKSCGGTYTPVQADGTQYFHRCPPLSLPELTAAVAGGKVTLPNGETPDMAVVRRSYDRNAVRDENLPGTRPTDAGKLKAAGAGTLIVADPVAPVVVALP
jgi:hypothetical protein